MDPKACLYLLCDLIAQGELAEAKHAARDLESWLIRGGFYPQLTERDQQVVIMALINLAHMKGPSDV